MTAPFANVTLADGRTSYLSPYTWRLLRRIALAGDDGVEMQKWGRVSWLGGLGLVVGVKCHGTTHWHWTITEHGKKVADGPVKVEAV